LDPVLDKEDRLVSLSGAAVSNFDSSDVELVLFRCPDCNSEVEVYYRAEAVPLTVPRCIHKKYVEMKRVKEG
jgi:uncharacterized protein with PIN domain